MRSNLVGTSGTAAHRLRHLNRMPQVVPEISEDLEEDLEEDDEIVGR